jgi:hypothetical protein
VLRIPAARTCINLHVLSRFAWTIDQIVDLANHKSIMWYISLCVIGAKHRHGCLAITWSLRTRARRTASEGETDGKT